jgi:hypothetical protein
MFSLLNLIWLILIGLVALYWWQSGVYKDRARELAQTHCHQHDLQFLDDSMVIVGFWPLRNRGGSPVFRRRYEFEFSSTGDERYRGLLVLAGMRLVSIELEVYKIPPAGQAD